MEVVSACYLNVLLLLVIKQHYLDTDGLNIETSRLISIAWVNWYNVVGMIFFFFFFGIMCHDGRKILFPHISPAYIYIDK